MKIQALRITTGLDVQVFGPRIRLSLLLASRPWIQNGDHKAIPIP